MAVQLGKRRPLHSIWPWEPGDLIRSNSLEISGTNACSSQCLVFPFSGMACQRSCEWQAEGQCCCSMGLVTGPAQQSSAPLQVCAGHGPFSSLIKVTHHTKVTNRNVLLVALRASQGTAACAAGKCSQGGCSQGCEVRAHQWHSQEETPL